MAQILVQQLAQMRRKLRSPQHPFFCSAPPFAIQPFFIAPVMPGETLKNLLLQARVVSRPVKSPLTGWWTEFYFFYVKLRDLRLRAEYTKMLLDPEWVSTPVDMTTVYGTSQKMTYASAAAPGMINYVDQCLECVVEEYFRDEGDSAQAWAVAEEAPGTRVWYVAQVSGNSVFDSMHQNTDVVAEDVEITVGVDDKIRASEIELAMRQWDMLKQANLTSLSYEDFLAAYGITPKPEEVHRPELVRFVREWTYPSNTVDPLTGAPSSALSWSVSERADKDRFLREPGFLFGVWCTRPKVYVGAQVSTFTNVMNNMFAWLPPGAAVGENASMKLVPDNVGPLPTLTDAGGYWLDVKDLFLYGEQFIGADLSGATVATRCPRVSLPSATLGNKRYCNQWVDIKGFFKDGTTPFVEVDGIVSMQIASTIRETTPRGGPVTDV